MKCVRNGDKNLAGERKTDSRRVSLAVVRFAKLCIYFNKQFRGKLFEA